MLDSHYSNVKALKNYLEKVRLLLEKYHPILLQNPQIGREFVIELDRIVMDFCKNPPQNIEELENFFAKNMLEAGIGSEVWREMLSFCGRVLGCLRESNREFLSGEIANTLYFFRNVFALLIGVAARSVDFYEGGAAASKN
ncbi:MAG: hypothetical protein V1661_03115 [bacterium]